jgi:hypothetical protein
VTSAAVQAVWKRCTELVEWYEKFKPDAGRRILVNLSAIDLWKCVHPNMNPEGNRFPREVVYRGRTLVAGKR